MFDEERYEEKLLSKSQSDVRIKLTDQEQDADDDDDDFEEEMDEDVWNRKHVKYNSEQILEKQQTKNRKKNKTKKRDAWESGLAFVDSHETRMSSPPVHAYA